jgi:alginate O-acetyltransferase complex protein AlgI
MRFITGLAKKVLIANTLGETADHIFDTLPPDQQTSAILWLGSFAYTFQIYFDFAGYSDMALGLARMMGFILPENFNFPYISGSITEFWRRWHITLGSWMRNYLYIPLGGNRRSKQRGYLNLCIVFLISGFWHGAAWNFILWGMFHGFFLVIERWFLLDYLQKIPRLISALVTLFIVNTGWVLFRIKDMSQIKFILGKMYSFNLHEKMIYFPGKKFFVLLFIAFFAALAGLFSKWYTLLQNDLSFYSGNSTRSIALTFASLILLFLSAAFIVAGDFNPFIYWRF